MISPAIASPLTNLLAPSIEPWKSASLRIVSLRSFASTSSIIPALRSASIAICLPGIASNVNRAATSATLPEPFVITIKFIITRIVKTITPTM